jgi:diadenosine tetraphosphate (Ap4A) HIT family hydrolase
MADIHPKLLEDCFIIGRFPLCHLLLMDDAHYPWFILVPDRDGLSEIYQLSDADQKQLLKESSLLAECLMNVFEGDKMNIAALGNIVPQCHIHHVVRYHGDPAWPAPIWGALPGKAYAQKEIDNIFTKLKQSSMNDFKFI